MVTQYFLLEALSRELAAALHDATITEVFSQHESELLIVLEHPASVQTGALAVSVKPHANYCYLRTGVQRAKKNSVDLFADAIGKNVVSVSIRSGERMVVFELDNRWKFDLHLFDTAASNILLLDEMNTIREAFKKNKELAGTALRLTQLRFDVNVLTDGHSFRSLLLKGEPSAIGVALKKTAPIFGTLYIRELLTRVGLSGEFPIRDLDDAMLETLHREMCSILNEALHPRPTIYTPTEGAPILSVIPLRHLSDARTEIYDSMNEAVRQSVRKDFRSKGLSSEKKSILTKIRSVTEHRRRALDKAIAHRQTDHLADEYERAGKLLLAHLGDVRKGMTKVSLPSTNSESRSIVIVLDAARTPVQNAERYFEKARKQRADVIESEKRIRDLTSMIETLSDLEHALEQCQSMDEVKEFKRTHAEKLHALNLVEPQKGKEAPPFRVFTVAGGYEVWVGKSSANNDLLTMKYAKPNDFWFHVRGAGGSHTILRSRGDGQSPPKEAIRQAASIAAYYSKMRTAGTVPVAYCERKYVRKPKGVKEGTVHLEREEVIFIKPKIPE